MDDYGFLGLIFSLLTLLVAIAGVAWARRGAEAASTQAASAEKQAVLTQQQLDLLQRKIGMVTDPQKMTEILPLWYIDRMGKDYWGFGLLLTSGTILGISQVQGVSDDGQWMEVLMLAFDTDGPREINGLQVLYAPTKDRLLTSVQITSVQAAFELWSS